MHAAENNLFANAILAEDVKSVVSAMRPVCASLDRRRIFLTGGTGFFGKWLLHSCLGLRKAYDLDLELTVLSRDPVRFLDCFPEFSRRDGLDFITGDIRSFTLPDTRTFDFVIHGATAASAKLEKEDPDEMYSVITDGTRHILELAQRCSVKKLLFVSSGAVYGTQPPALNQVPETYEGLPSAAYGKGKKHSELLCLAAASGRFECVIARPFAFVGPYLPLDQHFAIGNFIRDCTEGRPITIQGDGAPLRSYLYAADLAEWLWTILLRGEHARPYNIGSSEDISIYDLARLVRECAGTQNEIIVRGTKVKDELPSRYVPSVERAKKELALNQRTSLSEAIRRTIAWDRSKPFAV